MGITTTLKVITGSNTIGRAVVVQPRNRDRVTAIEAINASSWSIPPVIILSRKLHQASWQRSLPANQVIALSNNSQTTNKLGFKQLKHFNRYIAPYIIGVYYLLILNSYSSYTATKFDQYYIENKIISLYMPMYISCLLQPLNISCFSPLKIAYGYKVGELAY